MKLEHTPALTSAFERATAHARREQAAALSARHLLVGLLAESEGRVASALAAAGLDAARLSVGLRAGAESNDVGDEPMPFDADAGAIMRRARELAGYHSTEGTITTDQLLLAVLEHDDVLRRELETAGLDFPRLRTEIAHEAAPIYLEAPLLLDEPAAAPESARILDAAANRAREALRVLEDYARFVLDDALLSGELKAMRHDLAEALTALPADLLRHARDTLHDVGTTLSTPREWDRPSVRSVVEVNAKRLQEALRSLEEYGKTIDAAMARTIEALRYRSYTLERALLTGASVRQRLAEARLCVLVTDALCRASLVGTVKEALLGGAQVIQLREKGIDDRTFLARAREVRRLTRDAGALFIVNDRPDVAALADADGVHLGQDDLPIHAARRLLGSDALIGVSTHNLDQLRAAVLEGAAYVGVGPTFTSSTKQFAQLAGLDFVRQASAMTTLPAFVLGGITLANVGAALEAGARRIAVSAAVCAADDPRAAARQLRAALDAATIGGAEASSVD